MEQLTTQNTLLSMHNNNSNGSSSSNSAISGSLEYPRYNQTQSTTFGEQNDHHQSDLSNLIANEPQIQQQQQHLGLPYFGSSSARSVSGSLNPLLLDVPQQQQQQQQQQQPLTVYKPVRKTPRQRRPRSNNTKQTSNHHTHHQQHRQQQQQLSLSQSATPATHHQQLQSQQEQLPAILPNGQPLCLFDPRHPTHHPCVCNWDPKACTCPVGAPTLMPITQPCGCVIMGNVTKQTQLLQLQQQQQQQIQQQQQQRSVQSVALVPASGGGGGGDQLVTPQPSLVPSPLPQHVFVSQQQLQKPQQPYQQQQLSQLQNLHGPTPDTIQNHSAATAAAAAAAAMLSKYPAIVQGLQQHQNNAPLLQARSNKAIPLTTSTNPFFNPQHALATLNERKQIFLNQQQQHQQFDLQRQQQNQLHHQQQQPRPPQPSNLSLEVSPQLAAAALILQQQRQLHHQQLQRLPLSFEPPKVFMGTTTASTTAADAVASAAEPAASTSLPSVSLSSSSAPASTHPSPYINRREKRRQQMSQFVTAAAATAAAASGSITRTSLTSSGPSATTTSPSQPSQITIQFARSWKQQQQQYAPTTNPSVQILSTIPESMDDFTTGTAAARIITAATRSAVSPTNFVRQQGFAKPDVATSRFSSSSSSSPAAAVKYATTSSSGSVAAGQGGDASEDLRRHQQQQQQAVAMRPGQTGDAFLLAPTTRVSSLASSRAGSPVEQF